MRISQEMKGVIMRNLRGTIFYIKTNVLQDFRICMSVPLISKVSFQLTFTCSTSTIEALEKGVKYVQS